MKRNFILLNLLFGVIFSISTITDSVAQSTRISGRAKDKTDESTAVAALQKPLEEHPRVFVTRESLVDLKRKWNSSSNQIALDLKEEIISRAKGRVAIGKSGLPSESFYRTMEANALLYLLKGDLAAGKKAKDMMVDNIALIGANLAPGVDQFKLPDGRTANRMILGFAMTYDWCYDLLCEAEMKTVISEVNRIAMLTDFKALRGWPIYPENYTLRDFINPHWAEEKHPCMLAFGIASFDQDPELYNLMADHLYNYFVPARNFLYQSGRVYYGNAYSVDRMFSDYTTTKLITAMGQDNPYDPCQENTFTSLIYARRPDGRYIPEGNDWLIFRDIDNYHFTELDGNALMAAISAYGNPYLQDEYATYEKYSAGARDEAFYFVLFPDQNPQAPISELPLTAYWGGHDGSMIARTSWEMGPQSDAAIVKMTMKQTNFAAHYHEDVGSFYIWYKGPLAIDAGAYKTYNDPNFTNYLTTAYAHNTMLIYDVDDVNGDQEIDSSSYDSIQYIYDNFSTSQVQACEVGPDAITPEYSYLKGDMAVAYGGKAKEAKRSFVALNFEDETYPGALIVYDRVCTDDATTKKWLLHSEEEPTIDGNIIKVEASKQRISTHDGLLVETLLYPALQDATIELVGGAGKEFMVDGVNWPLSTKNQEADIINYEAGRWRVEISNSEKSTTSHFLNAMHYKSASDGKAILETKLIETDKILGAQIYDRVVIFSKSGAKMSGTINLTIEGEGSYKTLFTDLCSGTWSVDGDDTSSVTEQGACGYVELSAGSHLIQIK